MAKERARRVGKHPSPHNRVSALFSRSTECDGQIRRRRGMVMVRQSRASLRYRG